MSKTILIVEDTESLRELTERAFSKRGFNTIAVESGEDALEHLKTTRPDLIVLDHQLPGEDGLDICHKIKSSEETKNIPILMTTGQALIKEPTGGKPGCIRPDHVLIKPFEIPDLIESANNLLEN